MRFDTKDPEEEEGQNKNEKYHTTALWALLNLVLKNSRLFFEHRSVQTLLEKLFSERSVDRICGPTAEWLGIALGAC